MAQPIGDRFIFGGRGRNLWRNQWEAVLYSRRPRAQHLAPPTGGVVIVGGRGRNLWCNQREACLFSAAKGANCGATNRKPFYSRRPSAQALAQPIGDSFIVGGRERNLWHNQ